MVILGGHHLYPTVGVRSKHAEVKFRVNQGHFWQRLNPTLATSNKYSSAYTPNAMREGPEDSYWCSKVFGTDESPTTTITIVFPSKVSSTGFTVKPQNGYPLFGNYIVKVDDVEVQSRTEVMEQQTAGWNVYGFSNELKGAKFELIVEKSSDASYNYMCIDQLEMAIGKGLNTISKHCQMNNKEDNVFTDVRL